MKPILAFETSSPVLSIALSVSKDHLVEETVEGLMTHAENILPVLEKLLKKNKLSIEDIDTFLIGQGPGSFTGLRIGFATLKGFLVLKKKPCYGALSLDLISENCPLPEHPATLAAALDAYREKIYVRLYKSSSKGWIPKGKPQTIRWDEMPDFLPANAQITGDALLRYREKWAAAMPDKPITFLKEAFWYPRAANLIRFFQRKDKKMTRLESPKDFIPLYFRLSEAEERKKETYAGTSTR